MPPSLPEAIGKYTIERFIESGGMGDVYLARDPALDRAVAIKFLREGFDNQEMRERFEREARAAGRLSHPNIVTIYEFGIFDGRPFIAMEFVRGEPLSKLIRRREPIPLVRKLEMMEGLCSGLAHAHKTGMVHRDIKPANLMVDNDGGPLKILDFGIVRMAGSGLTSHGVLVGTINYMSPEQITGRGTIDLRSDVFAVGAVLHEVFTYQRAFPGEMTDVLYKIVHAQPESAATLSPGLDPGVVRAIDQCLEKTPERRYQDLGVLRRELARIRQRLELEETDGSGHTALTLRQPKDPSSHASRPSGAHRTPVSGTPAPSTPPSPSSRPSAPSGPPQTPGSDRARRAAEAAADLARAQRAAEEARLELERESEEQARLEAERLEQERQEQERAERARLARERAQAEQARLERQQAERVRAEQARAEQARIEQARQDQARLEQARLDKARAEEAEHARVERERQEQARLEEARKAREQAERERAEAQRKAEAEAKRQAEARREQRQRDLTQAQKDVAAGRFAEAAGLLRPWSAESAGDATFAAVLEQAEAGVAQARGRASRPRGAEPPDRFGQRAGRAAGLRSRQPHRAGGPRRAPESHAREEPRARDRTRRRTADQGRRHRRTRADPVRRQPGRGDGAAGAVHAGARPRGQRARRPARASRRARARAAAPREAGPAPGADRGRDRAGRRARPQPRRPGRRGGAPRAGRRDRLVEHDLSAEADHRAASHRNGRAEVSPATPGGESDRTGSTEPGIVVPPAGTGTGAGGEVQKETPKIDNGAATGTATPPVTVPPPVTPGTTRRDQSEDHRPAGHERRHPAPDAYGRSTAGRLGADRRAR